MNNNNDDDFLFDELMEIPKHPTKKRPVSISILKSFIRVDKDYLFKKGEESDFIKYFKGLGSEERRAQFVYSNLVGNYLHASVYFNNIDVVKVIFEVDPTFPLDELNSEKSTAIYIAASKNYLEIFSYLLAKGANIKEEYYSLLVSTAKGNSTDILRKLISTIPPDKNLFLNTYDKLPLFVYICKNSKDSSLIQIMQENGFDLNTILKGRNLYPIVISESEEQSIEKTMYLLKNSLNINHIEIDMSTPIYHVINRGYLELLKIYIDSGAELNIINEKKMSPLDHAVISSNYSKGTREEKRLIKNIIESLISKGAKFYFIKDKFMLHHHIKIIKYKFNKKNSLVNIDETITSKFNQYKI